MKFKKVLLKTIIRATQLGLIIKNSEGLDPYFKGDLDGVTIHLGDGLSAEDQLFNVLHLVGHCIQWNTNEELRALGDKLYDNPDDATIRKLQEYEWEANCYALQMLHDVKVRDMDIWLYDKYLKDTYYLTHFYKTGEKIKDVSDIALKYSFTKLLSPKKIPDFIPIASINTRNGIVI